MCKTKVIQQQISTQELLMLPHNHILDTAQNRKANTLYHLHENRKQKCLGIITDSYSLTTGKPMCC